MEPEEIQFIKKLALFAMFSDDKLMNRLVLKGGNVLDIIYGVATRSSIDIDFSIEGDFPQNEMIEIKNRIEQTLRKIFRENGYEPFDIKITERPKQVSTDMEDFWGGYRIEFKVIATSDYQSCKGELRTVREKAVELGRGQKKAFKIEISKFEYCQDKKPMDLEGRTIYIYTPTMIVFEKLRAICQQMPEYADIAKKPSQSARARDFFDIHTVMDNFNLNLTSPANVQLLRNIFAVKKVPLHFIGLIAKYREFHRPDFASVEDTVKLGVNLKGFDFYFDFVIDKCVSLLKPFWEE